MIQSDFHILQRGRYTTNTNQLFFFLVGCGAPTGQFCFQLSSGNGGSDLLLYGIHIPYEMGSDLELPRVSQPHTGYPIFINSNWGWSLALGLHGFKKHVLIHIISWCIRSFIVRCPIQNNDVPSFFVNVYQAGYHSPGRGGLLQVQSGGERRPPGMAHAALRRPVWLDQKVPATHPVVEGGQVAVWNLDGAKKPRRSLGSWKLILD